MLLAPFLVAFLAVAGATPMPAAADAAAQPAPPAKAEKAADKPVPVVDKPAVPAAPAAVKEVKPAAPAKAEVKAKAEPPKPAEPAKAEDKVAKPAPPKAEKPKEAPKAADKPAPKAADEPAAILPIPVNTAQFPVHPPLRWTTEFPGQVEAGTELELSWTGGHAKYGFVSPPLPLPFQPPENQTFALHCNGRAEIGTMKRK